MLTTDVMSENWGQKKKPHCPQLSYIPDSGFCLVNFVIPKIWQNFPKILAIKTNYTRILFSRNSQFFLKKKWPIFFIFYFFHGHEKA
jgi:hypothetical protein